MNALALAGPFGVSLVVLCALERVLNAFLGLFFWGKDSVKVVRAQLVLGGALGLMNSVLNAVVSVFLRCLYVLSWLLLWYLVFYCVSIMWYVLYEQYPDTVLHMFDFYSKKIGPFVHGFLLLPLEFFNLFFKGVLPLYNGFIWIMRTLLLKGFLPIMWDNVEFLRDMSVFFLDACRAFSAASSDFLAGLHCEKLKCLEDSAVFDVISIMSSVKGAVVIASQLTEKMCYPVSVPMQLMMYPLTDFRFAKGIHGLVNALLQVAVHVPHRTLKRCKTYGSNESVHSVLMCTPDLQPVFDHAVGGVRDLGSATDNWLGIGAAMIKQNLERRVPAKKEYVFSAEICTKRTLNPSVFRGVMLSGPQITVGLTDWLMAASNGSMAYFFGQVTTDTVPRMWPEPVDVSFGVAAVSYDETGEVEVSGVTQGQRPLARQTTSLLGCRCLDTDKGLVIRCSVLNMLGQTMASTHSFDVAFQDSSWSSGMQCRSVEVSVRSVRWPVRRYEGKTVKFGVDSVNLPEPDCMSRESCESVDATIWLVPKCDLLRPEQCSDAAVGTSCFPFCMASRISGSRNANPVLVNAEVWRTGRQILQRDCALGQISSSVNSAFTSGAKLTVTSVYGETTMSEVAGGSLLFVSGSGDGSRCLTGSNMVSWTPLNVTVGDPRSVSSYVRRKGQPFAIAGDTIFMEFPTPDGSSKVEVDRLSGNQKDVYSLVPGWAGLPTAPKRIVPIQELTQEEQARVVVPLDFVATRVPSTSSRNYVFYAVSPDLKIFQAYLDYCRDKDSLPQVQFMMLSSYSVLRVYRVRAYCQERCEVGALSAQYTFDGFSNGRFTAANFPQDCSRVYNASVDGLEYVNEQNVAVTVQVADHTYDPVQRSGIGSVYKTYWLNPMSMEVRLDQMWPSETPSALNTETCIVGDGVPHLGTLGAELVVAGLHIAHKTLGAFLYAPGLLALWRGGSLCPLESRGHSVLASCGRNVFDLDDVFDSLDSATAVFWGIPAWIAEQLEQGKQVDYSPVSDLLRGLGAYGRGTVGITEVNGGFLSLLNTPLPEQFAATYALLRQPGALAGAARVVGGATSWARYSSRFMCKVGVGVAQLVVMEGVLSPSNLWRTITGTLYDERSYFKSTVTDRGRSACLGLEVLVGGATPSGRLLHHSCLSSVLLFDGAMDVFLRLLVDAPILKCVCKDSEGKTLSTYARDFCLPKSPKTMQPVLLGMIAAAQKIDAGDALLCSSVIQYTKNKMDQTMRPYFSSVYNSLNAVGDLFDYMLIGFDSDAGQCSDFDQNPQVVVIMPEPVDYFQGCGSTTSCKAKCAGPWEAFETARSRHAPSDLQGLVVLEQSIDSMFFPSVVKDMIAPGRVLAMTSPDACGILVCRRATDKCLVTATFGDSEIAVVYFCVPISPAASVYQTEKQDLNWGAVLSTRDVRQVSFVKSDGSSVAALLDKSIWLLQRGAANRLVVDVGYMRSLLLLGMYPMYIMDFIAVQDRLLVNVAARTVRNDEFEREVCTIWVEPHAVLDLVANVAEQAPFVVQPALKDLWRGYAVSEYPLAEEQGRAKLLLWPLTSTGSLRRVSVQWTSTSFSVMSIEPFVLSKSLVSRATLMPRELVLSKRLVENREQQHITIFATNGAVYDWLRQLRLTGLDLDLSSASLSNAQPVSANISIGTDCDGTDCRGCTDLTLRSLCSSYQSCAVLRCIGTPINLKRPLCGVGGTLKSLGLVGVESVQGAWVMFVDIYMILLQLRVVSNLPGVDVSFPEDSFMSNVCAVKDVSAELISVLISTVNSALQRAQSITGVFSHSSSVDSSFNTMASMSTAAVTGFLNQIALAPVYVLSVGHKVMMCQVSGVLAVVGQSGFEINIQSAKFSSTDAIGGRCLTKSAEVSAQQTGDAQALQTTSSQAANFLTFMGSAGISSYLEPVMHVADGVLTYAIGVVSKFADVLQTIDTRHCVLPDVTLKSTVRCACGDTGLSIIHARRVERLRDFSYWCTGTLALPDAENRLQIVWNPYSYRELQDIVGEQLDVYVAAAGSDALATAPNHPLFAKQGVSMFAVLTRCRQNYVNKQWDAAAYARYDRDLLTKEIRGDVLPDPGDPADGVGRCLLDSVQRGAGNGACLDIFLSSRGHDESYWAYAIVNDSVSSERLDGCVVFSGPASNQSINIDRRLKFQNCVSGYTELSHCDLSSFVWSPASSNAVPVAARHVVHSDGPSHLEDAVAERMRRASAMVMRQLTMLDNYTNPELQAAVFSAEGDVIHQLLDCVFMGPYARMDYWPAPRCDETTRPDCLVGPYWSRDAQMGKSRGIDLDKCETTQELPFTCGSPTRKAMVKDFVKQYLELGEGSADLLQQLINEWLNNQTKLWWDHSAFYCNASNDDCLEGYLPSRLSGVSLQLSTKPLINALHERVRLFHKTAFRSSEPWISFLDQHELSKYNWTTSTGAHEVRSSAAYHPAHPTLAYFTNEAMSPPTTFASPSLWHTCHSALKQVMFTMPVNDDGTLSGGVPEFSGGSVERISEHVKSMVHEAYEHSPLYWHYQPRHHPSESRLCHGAESRDARTPRGTVQFEDYKVNNFTVFDASQVLPVAALGFDAGVLGGAWNGSYAGLTEHVGFLDRTSTEAWLRGGANFRTSGEFLLRHGAGGVKAGNLPRSSRADLGFPEEFTGDLHDVLAKNLKETERLHGVDQAMLHGCVEHEKSTESALGKFVDGLFPMAQGIRESGLGAYCLRFAIELAMLYAMEINTAMQTEKFVLQRKQVSIWRKKCGTQVQLIGMCNALDIYRDGGFQPYACLYSWQYDKNESAGMYVTPDCLVRIENFFYDPCVCRPDWCEQRNSTLRVNLMELKTSQCAMRLDPRTVVHSVELGWWAEDDADPAASAWNAWLEDPINFLQFDRFVENVLTDENSVGNTPSGLHWATAEGFMNETGAFCDMVADYWPENAAFPVGYHVTVPCDFSETGYRTFDNVFVQDTDDEGQPVMKFVEDQSRWADVVDSHFGAGGLCRGMNFGFDMFETNTMRLCTRVTDGEDVDVHVPRGQIMRDAIGEPRCSASSLELPWGDSSFYDYYDAAFYSVGTVPNLPSESAMFYPESNERLLFLGPQHSMNVEGWGATCQDLSIPNCSNSEWRCPTGFTCTASGVCQHPRVQCTRHSHCPEEKMCTGMGVCQDPVVSVDNQLGEDASFRAHTASCAGQSFSMIGGSHWGYVPDLLEAHGMCSYRHWQEYLYTMQKCNCTSQSNGGCKLDARTCPYYIFSNQVVNNKWWNSTDPAPTRMKMIPSTCDRDYERFSVNDREMQSCVPESARSVLLKPDGTYNQHVSRDSFWRIYDNAQRSVLLKLMPNRNDPSIGFLGVKSFGGIKSCFSVQQCFVDVFTKNGKESMTYSGIRKADRTTFAGAMYNPDDQFKCGVIGYYDSKESKCVVDYAVFPLYYVFCDASQKTVADKCSTSIHAGSLPARCDDVQRFYSPQYSVIQDVNVPALNAFFNIFKKPHTLSEHLAVVECTTSIYEVISQPHFGSRGLYYAFAFTLYEVPFSWFYQCNIGRSLVVSNQLDKKLYPCTFYSNRNELAKYTHPLDMRYTEFASYIFNVRGGYVRSTLESERMRQLNVAVVAWKDAVEQVRAQLFGVSSAADLTYPRCYTKLLWRLPSSLDLARKLIEAFVRNRCSSNLISRYVQIYNERYGTSHSVKNILQELTVMGGNLTEQELYVANNKLLTGFVLSWGLDWLNREASLDRLDVSVTPIRFRYEVPNASSSEFTASIAAWKLRSGVLPNTQDVRVKENVQECEISQLVDVYRDTDGRLLVADDTDLQAGLGTTVKTCPVYAEGLFGCSYPAVQLSGRLLSVQGTLGGVEDQFDIYAAAVFSEVKRRYDVTMNGHANSKTIRPMVMSELKFFNEETNMFFGDFSFNLQKVADYMSNINPDVRTPVMCVAGNQQIDYNNCTDANYLALRQHVYSEYSKDGGVVVPDRSQLNWRVSKSMMTNGAIFSFTSTNRDISKRFLNRLFDSPSVCSASAANREDRMCYFDNVGVLGNRAAITPWLSGWWNPFDQCDVDQMDAQSGNTETIDSYCYFNEYCPADRGVSTSTVDYYKYMPNNNLCISRNKEKTNNLNVNPKLLYNLCRHDLVEDSICTHTQGMVGGSDGFPAENYAVNGNLFSLHEFSGYPSGDGSFFGNVLLHGARSDYGFLRFSNSHIGGHHLGMRIVDGAMKVWRMPLKSVMDKSMMASWNSMDVSEWVPRLHASMKEDHRAYLESVRNVDYVVGTDGKGQPRFGWDCPLRRRAFYTGGVENFKPHLPSARRSNSIFGQINGGLYAHPTQHRKDGSVHFGRYKTTNGFCFCPVTEETWPDMCGVAVNVQGEHNCSLFNTVNVIQGLTWGWSHTFLPRTMSNTYKVCTTQVDWPFINGTLRDGGSVRHDDVDETMWRGASDVESRRCHVLDRMPDFSYAYVSRRQLRRSGFTTLSKGVCHTGRAQRIFGSDRRCVKVAKSDFSATILCTNNRRFEVSRPKSLSARSAVEKTRFYRRRCDRCTRPPKFTTREGYPIKAESSFGMPYRVSTERVISRDLRKALCNNETYCEKLLNFSSWQKGLFLNTLLHSPRQLFKSEALKSTPPTIANSYKPTSSPPPTDDSLWARPWVHCPTKESLKTGKGCNGTITKERWRRDKVGSCYATTVEAIKGGKDPFASTDVCNIDSRFAELCKTIREAQSLIASANCIRSGSSRCALKEFVYSPSTWESSNRAFVHQTVKEYYMQVDGCTSEGSCVCGEDGELAELRKNNSNFFRECTAVPVIGFRNVLMRARSLLFPMCKIIGTVTELAFNLVLMMSSSTRDAATSKVVLGWAQFKQESAVITDKVSDLVFDMLFSTGVLGPWMQKGVLSACNSVNSAYMYTASVWCSLVVNKFPVFLSSLRSIGGWIDVGFTVVNDIFAVILNNYLPEAMLDLYNYGYSDFFFSTKYLEKQQAYEKRKKAGLVNPEQSVVLENSQKSVERRPDNKIMNELGRSRGEKMNKKSIKTGSAVAGALPYVGEVVDMALTAVELTEQIRLANDIKEMLERFPKSFTLFDFDGFYGAIDMFVDFLNRDFMCFSIDKDVPPLQCTALNFTAPSRADADVMAPRASACWAEAQERNIGISNLYACTPTSTCCVDPLNCDVTSGARLCADCPSAVDGFRKYGCNTMIQRCQCGVSSVEIDRCISHRECGSGASCSMVTSLDDVSFGALDSCSECPTPSICLMGSNQQYGECTCLSNAETKVDICGVATGAAVNPDPSRLCGYVRDFGSVFLWSELALVRCVNAVRPICAEVVSENGGVLKISVCKALKNSQVAYSNRRLLSTELDFTRMQLPSVFFPSDPADDVTADVVHEVVTGSEWNHTSSPCSTLAHSYVAGKELGPVDESTLHSCVYWRTVARRLISENGLVALQNSDTFLLSAGDFASSIGQRGVLEELLRKPWVLVHAALYSQWVKPMRAALVASHDPNISALVRNITNYVKKLQTQRPPALRQAKVLINATRRRMGRRLMGVWEDTLAEVKSMPYYSMMQPLRVNASDFINDVSGAWSIDHFSWKRVEAASECPVGDVLASNFRYVMHVTRLYYNHMPKIMATSRKNRTLRDVLPNFQFKNTAVVNDVRKNQDTNNLVLYYFLGLLGVSMNDVADFFKNPCPKHDCFQLNKWTASYFAESVMFCSYEDVMFCSEYRNDLIFSTVFVAFCWVLLSVLLSYMNLGGLGSALFFVLPIMIVWYSTGSSPRCFPMIPACLMDDFIEAIKTLLPFRVDVPPLLLLNASSLRSCDDVGLNTWEDLMTFWICDAGFCRDLENSWLFGVSHWRFKDIQVLVTDGHVNAYRLCAFVQLNKIIPVLVIITFTLTFASAFCLSVVSLLSPFFDLIWKTITYNHTT